jgi:hypothetical protein
MVNRFNVSLTRHGLDGLNRDAHCAASGAEQVCKLLPIVPLAYYAHAARQADPAKGPARRWHDADLSALESGGSEYTERLAEAGIEPSAGSAGDGSASTLAEAINGLCKAEVFRRRGP